MDQITARTRSYQLEMFERSMQENIIVAMDTGSGKTHMLTITLLVWFLAPHVALCEQQYNALRIGLPSVRIKLLIGNDNVDRWSEQRIWDAALDGVRVMVSTHKILEEALAHSFVKIKDLALLVFDEAHHCIRKHPANKIMANFYYPKKSEHPDQVPRVLGLTATPIVRSKLHEMNTVERNLDAIAVTTKLHRDELFRFVHRPDLVPLVYKIDCLANASTALERLRQICSAQAVSPAPTDALRSKSIPQLPWKEQLAKFRTKAHHVLNELGPWATDLFILESIKVLEKSGGHNTGLLFSWTDQEHRVLTKLLCKDPVLSQLQYDIAPSHNNVSKKMACLLSFLGSRDASQSTAIIFVQQRVITGLLSQLLSAHPSTSGSFQCAAFVGMSQNRSKKYNLPELLDMKEQLQTLASFRARAKNVIVATNALEEGIDVRACNLVICFDLPQNLKSFIQRRGRARQEKSVFALMFSEEESQDRLAAWKTLEDDLQRLYQDASRLRVTTLHLEQSERVDYSLKSSTTGATLTAEDTMAHLHHFCAKLPVEPFTDMRPMFSYKQEPPGSEEITAVVTLPNCVDASVRVATSLHKWKTEKNAAKDAAFQAYTGLYSAGLLNENLLPLSHDFEMQLDVLDKLGSQVDIDLEYSPWQLVAQAWSSTYVYDLAVQFNFHERTERPPVTMKLAFPCELPDLQPLRVQLTADATVYMTFQHDRRRRFITPTDRDLMRKVTHIISRSTHSDYSSDDRIDFLALFTPVMEDMMLQTWLTANKGRIKALELVSVSRSLIPRGFVRHTTEGRQPQIFNSWTVNKDTATSNLHQITCTPLPSRRNFRISPPEYSGAGKLKIRSDNKEEHPKLNYYPLDECTIDRLPVEIARLSLLLPTILQHIANAWIADRMCQTVLKEIPFRSLDLVITAITPPSVQWCTNYETLEFLGDSILKLVVSIQLYDRHKNWPEGYLTLKRAVLVSNQYLAKAALKAGLSTFIRTTPISWKRWSPIFISDMMAKSSCAARTVRMKVLADVVEALIGAAFVDGGFGSAETCIRHLLPGLDNGKLSFAVQTDKGQMIANQDRFESVIGYEFRHPCLLVEALTHPSCERDRFSQSYQRLEFLGDAVLDSIIASQLMTHKVSSRSPGVMTRVKSAMVNAHLLGFFCMEFYRTEEFEFVQQQQPDGKFNIETETTNIYLWQLMRSHNDVVRDRRIDSLDRFEKLGGSIRRQLDDSSEYPWLDLSMLRPEKFFSDIIESLVGAIYVDSKGSLEKCSTWLDYIGLIKYLRRVLDENIDVVHPRTKVDWKTGAQTTEYKVSKVADPAEKFQCILLVDEKTCVQVDGYDTSDVAIVAAAQKALSILP
ncbi:Dicer-like protein 2 [Fonsecaea pedrosoi]|nr:Dicer-like protein 2 [Fonsecaea pedrosoi]